jgi:hypothetical protein
MDAYAVDQSRHAIIAQKTVFPLLLTQTILRDKDQKKIIHLNLTGFEFGLI